MKRTFGLMIIFLGVLFSLPVNGKAQLPARDFINLNIDLNIHGVGGDDTWGAKTMAKYTNSANRSYEYGFILEYTPGLAGEK